MEKDELVAIRLKPSQLDNLDKEADKAGMNRSAFIRDLIDKQLVPEVMAISNSYQKDFKRLKELTNSISDREMITKLIKHYKDTMILNQYDFRSEWKLDERRKVVSRFSKDMEYVSADITDLLENDIPKLMAKNKDNKSKLNLISVMKNSLMVMRAEDNLNNLKKKQEQDQLVNELEALRKEIAELKKEKLKAKLNNNN